MLLLLMHQKKLNQYISICLNNLKTYIKQTTIKMNIYVHGKFLKLQEVVKIPWMLYSLCKLINQVYAEEN
ncbi:hypothetical protein [uncultured Methanobrevibacter sp.]|uniref:hypothetical protein n=1 Tax=uncultured Methanobrevibacter sp. TaxID=253161 RepID=UPI00261CDD47